jgi:halocyanin-like protein
MTLPTADSHRQAAASGSHDSLASNGQETGDSAGLSRRALLAAVAGGATLAGCSGGDEGPGPPVGDTEATDDPDSDANTPPEDGTSWLSGVDNYDGYVDRTGESTVTVAVGAPGNDGDFAFDPAAVRVTAGTSVVWEWTGEGGPHGVAERTGEFESDVTDAAGFTFERTVDGSAVVRYYCPEHRERGMRGAVLVQSA